MKKNKVIYWIATVWLAVGLLSTAIIQIFRIQTEGAGGIQNVSHLGYPSYILPLLGIWKLLAVVALLWPKRPLWKEWAYAGIFFTATGALYSHIASGDSFALMVPALLYIILIATSWYFRPVDRKFDLK